MNLRIYVKGVDQVVSYLNRRDVAMEKAMKTATFTASRMVARVARKQLFVARQVSQQDSGKARKLSGANPITMRIDSKTFTGTITVRPHYTRVRSPKSAEFREGVVKLFSAEETTRKSLWIRRPKIGKKQSTLYAESKRDNSGRQDLKRFNLGKHSWLKQWAEREDRGKQVRRHVLYLRSGNTLKRLAVDPTIQETAPIVIGIYRDAILKGALS